MQKQNVMKIVRIALVCVFATVFVVSAVMLVNTLIDYRAASELYGQVHDDFMSAIGNTTGTPEQNAPQDVWTRGPEGIVSVPGTQAPVQPDTQPPSGDVTTPSGGQSAVTTPAVTTPPAPVYSERFLNACEFIKSLQATNPQVIGYIYVEIAPGNDELNISYPILRADDNDYYIDHAYDNSQIRAGAIFLDYRNNKNLMRNVVSVVYGHNMSNGAMFHNLKYLKQSQYFNSATITVYTLDGIYTYKPFSIYNTDADSGYTRMFFESDAQYLSFLEAVNKKSLVTSNMEFYNTDKVITLSTCLNTSPDARMAVHAVLVGVSQ